MGIGKSVRVCCSVKGHIFVDLQIKGKFHCQKSVIIHGCPLTRERKEKKNPIFTFISVRVRFRECVNAEFGWEGRRGIKIWKLFAYGGVLHRRVDVFKTGLARPFFHAK